MCGVAPATFVIHVQHLFCGLAKKLIDPNIATVNSS